MSVCVCVCSKRYSVFKCMRHIAIRGLLGSTTFFHIIWWTVRAAGKKIFFFKKCYLIFSKTYVWNISNFKKNASRNGRLAPLTSISKTSVSRDAPCIIHVHRCSCKVPVILVRFYWNLNFLYIFSKNTLISNFIKIRPLGAELSHVDRRTNRHDEANSRFLRFCERA